MFGKLKTSDFEAKLIVKKEKPTKVRRIKLFRLVISKSVSKMKRIWVVCLKYSRGDGTGCAGCSFANRIFSKLL